MVHKNELANTNKTENPLAQANYMHSIFSSAGTWYPVILVECLSITWDSRRQTKFCCQLSVSFERT